MPWECIDLGKVLRHTPDHPLEKPENAYQPHFPRMKIVSILAENGEKR